MFVNTSEPAKENRAMLTEQTRGGNCGGDKGDMSAPNIPTGDDMLHVPPKLPRQCMPFSSLTSFHSIQLQK